MKLVRRMSVVGHYVELGGVRTWYDARGDGDPLALLHPGGADARAWGPNLDALAAHFRVLTPSAGARAARRTFQARSRMS